MKKILRIIAAPFVLLSILFSVVALVLYGNVKDYEKDVYDFANIFMKNHHHHE